MQVLRQLQTIIHACHFVRYRYWVN